MTNSGTVSADDLKCVMGRDFDEAALRAMLDEADVGSNGKIDFQDFLRIVVDETRYDQAPPPVRCDGACHGDRVRCSLSSLVTRGLCYCL